jgi:Uma2 family endonuclease
MTVDEFLAWAQDQPGRYELVDGEIYTMSPEAAGHAEVKLAVHMAFVAAIRSRNLPCRLLPDGMTVRVDKETAYEPDALVYCGEKLPRSALEVPEPLIVVEVLSPSTRRADSVAKLAGYFRVPSVAHYLVVDPGRPQIIHYSRQGSDALLTRIYSEGAIALDPPGIELQVADFYAPI